MDMCVCLATILAQLLGIHESTPFDRGYSEELSGSDRRCPHRIMASVNLCGRAELAENGLVLHIT